MKRVPHHVPRSDPAAPVTALDGIGAARARDLARRGVRRVRDLFLVLPSRLVAWQERVPIATVLSRAGEEVIVRATITSARLTRLPGRRSMFTLRVTDGTASVDAVFFNQPWLRERLTSGMEVELLGKMQAQKAVRLLVQSVGTSDRPLPPAGALVPAYPAVEGFSPAFLARTIRSALPYADALEEPLERAVLERHALPLLPHAVRELHAPTSPDAHARARRRVALEPLLAFQARLARRRAERRGDARPIVLSDAEAASIESAFPFALTEGQRRAVAAIRADLARRRPMQRLLQGDVGCGKTAVAAWAALAVARGGGQAAFLAPTELLAEQHHDALAERLAAAGARAVLLTASLGRAERARALAELASGAASVAFGTHALFSKDVAYARLDLAIIDEQQRFGVGQRLALERKGNDVHLLLTTATPIPRTLAHTLYGDLDLVTIEDRPAGRGEVRTEVLGEDGLARALALLRAHLEGGERAYWVCPRLAEGADAEDDESSEERAGAERRHRELVAAGFERFGVELVHGRLEREQRAARLDAFRSGRARLLVATSVIEVGVDVPDATVLVVEGAERFGLAQLHQLRGRIGRGPRASWCYLLGARSAAARLALLARETSGFAIAEEDLRLRGMGDLAGVRQSGENAEGLGEGDDAVELVLLARELVRGNAALAARYASGDDVDWTP